MRLDRRGDAAVAAVDLDLLDRVAGALGEGEADPAEAAVAALDAGDDGVVVGLRGVVGADRLDLVLGDGAGLEASLGRVAERELDEGVVGARLGARAR